ncbi:YgaP family membrane protein [Echinicola shivajiensis]|uniref:YgaP family membrane protein n=1 Tax=Echinicola shivajiensis TaxID=1035916 RepID=UPI0037431645
MGILDRAIRMSLAIVLIILASGGFVVGFWSTILIILGGILLLTGAFAYCPLYSVLGISTCHNRGTESR